MPKRLPNTDAHPKPIQANIPVDTQEENTNQLIEMAAEQLADLLWKCWLASNNPKTEKRTKSGSRPDSPGSP